MNTALVLLHFLTVGALAAVLFAEWSQLRGRLEAGQIGFLLKLDLSYLLLAVLVLASGFARATLGDKPWVFYAHHPAFHAKLGLFVLIGLISVVPTFRFFRWRRAGVAEQAEVLATRRWLLAELLLLPLIPLCAVLLARGGW